MIESLLKPFRNNLAVNIKDDEFINNLLPCRIYIGIMSQSSSELLVYTNCDLSSNHLESKILPYILMSE